MPDPLPVPFPAPPEIEARRGEGELEHRMRALHELARIAADRAHLHAALAQRHDTFWLGDWERQKAGRLHELARIIASPEFAGFVRGHVGLRDLFSRDVPPPLPKRPRSPNRRRSRAKPKPFDDVFGAFDLGGLSWPKL